MFTFLHFYDILDHLMDKMEICIFSDIDPKI